MNDLISKQEALEDLSEPFVMSQCLTVEECDHMNFARALCIARIESIEAAQRWIPVTEPPEKKNRHYLVYLDDDSMCVAYWAEGTTFGKRTGEWTWFVPNWKEVTHWMPLPEPPKEEP